MATDDWKEIRRDLRSTIWLCLDVLRILMKELLILFSRRFEIGMSAYACIRFMSWSSKRIFSNVSFFWMLPPVLLNAQFYSCNNTTSQSHEIHLPITITTPSYPCTLLKGPVLNEPHVSRCDALHGTHCQKRQRHPSSRVCTFFWHDKRLEKKMTKQMYVLYKYSICYIHSYPGMLSSPVRVANEG